MVLKTPSISELYSEYDYSVPKEYPFLRDKKVYSYTGEPLSQDVNREFYRSLSIVLSLNLKPTDLKGLKDLPGPEGNSGCCVKDLEEKPYETTVNIV